MSELIDRMRTCAAAIRDRIHDAPMPAEHMLDDAADLLEAAAAELENPPVVLQPWVPIEAPTPTDIPRNYSGPVWTDPGVPDLPTQPLSRNVCPKCDTWAAKTVHATKNGFRLECPVCGHNWKR